MVLPYKFINVNLNTQQRNGINHLYEQLLDDVIKTGQKYDQRFRTATINLLYYIIMIILGFLIYLILRFDIFSCIFVPPQSDNVLIICSGSVIPWLINSRILATIIS